MTRAEPPREHTLAFTLPTGLTLRFLLLIVCVVPVTTRLAESVVGAWTRLSPEEMPPGCLAWLVQAGRAIRQGGSVTELVGERPECFHAPNPLPLEPAAFALVMLACLVAVQVAFGPALRIRLRGLVPLPEGADPGLDELLRDCGAVAGVRVRFLVNVLNTRVNAAAFGHPGRRYVVLDRGLVALAGDDPAAVRAVVLHELAHVRNRDLDITALTQASWRSFTLGMLVPIGLLTLADELPGPYNRWLTAWQLALFAVLVLLLRNSILRTKEHHADLRALLWTADPAALARMFERTTRSRRARRPFRLHPGPAERRAALAHWNPLWTPDMREVFGLGVVGGLAWPSVLLQAQEIGLFGMATDYVGWQLTTLVVPMGLVLGTAVCRTAWYRRAAHAPDRSGALGLAFGAGLVTGTLLTPVQSGLNTFPLGLPWEWELLLAGTILLGCWLSAGWTAVLARAWAWVRGPALAPAAAAVTALGTAALLAAWLTPLVAGRLDLMAAAEPPAAALAEGGFVAADLARFADTIAPYLVTIVAAGAALAVLGVAGGRLFRADRLPVPPRQDRGTTMSEPEDSAPEAPPGVDLEKPSPARIYDWYLGGTQNWAVDREFGRRIEQLWPHAKDGSRHNRQFMNRAVRAALAAGIRQFIDLGSGVPTVGNVHEVVRDNLPEGERGSVVYVDYEEVAAAHARLILEREDATSWATLIQHDMRDPAAILNHPETRRLIDFDQPVCLLMIAVLHFAGPDDRPAELIGRYLRDLRPGSWLALSHMTCPDDPELAEGVLTFAEQYKATANPVWLRTREEIEGLFDGLTLLEPGITHLPDWRPETGLTPREAKARPFAWCGVAEKP